MRQHDLPGSLPDDLLQDLCAVFIVEMTVIVDDALFDVYGPAGLHQHLHIVVAFKDVIVGIADAFLHIVSHITGIGHIDEFFAVRLQHEADRVFRVMAQRQLLT